MAADMISLEKTVPDQITSDLNKGKVKFLQIIQDIIRQKCCQSA